MVCWQAGSRDVDISSEASWVLARECAQHPRTRACTAGPGQQGLGSTAGPGQQGVYSRAWTAGPVQYSRAWTAGPGQQGLDNRAWAAGPGQQSRAVCRAECGLRAADAQP